VTDLVVGAGGFVGPHLVHLLWRLGRDVVAADLHPADGIDETCDICDRASVDATIARIRPERVFHLAAQSSPHDAWEQPELTFRINVGGTLNVLLACREHAPGCRVLFVSTSTVYGQVPEEAVPLLEERRIFPPGPYEASKALAERLCEIVGWDDRIHVVITRSFNHTGPGQGTRFVVPIFARRVAEVAMGMREPTIPTGNLDPQRDFTDVRDVVRAYVELLDRGDNGGVYNVCSGEVRTVGSILVDLLRLAGSDAELVPDPSLVREHDLAVLTGDTTRLREALGWVPAPMGDRTLQPILDEALAALKAELDAGGAEI
jgi:GDP-4-dehydro-6-deoxy-D-mannose reductase